MECQWIANISIFSDSISYENYYEYSFSQENCEFKNIGLD